MDLTKEQYQADLKGREDREAREREERRERDENLEVLEEALRGAEGLDLEQTEDLLRRASLASIGRPNFPWVDDPLGNAAKEAVMHLNGSVQERNLNEPGCGPRIQAPRVEDCTECP